MAFPNTSSGGGGGATGGLTNAQLRAKPLEVHPTFTQGGNIIATTSANGSDFVPYASIPCGQLTIINDTNHIIEYQQGGEGDAAPVLSQASFTLFGISNASEIAIRRKDLSVEPIEIAARWESIT